MDEPVSDKEKDWEETAARAQVSTAYNDDAQSRHKFPEVTGLCRTCEHAWITRRAYSEVPAVHCMIAYDAPIRMPLDVKECSRYRKEGQMSLRDMSTLGIIIDKRRKGGQYL